MKNIDILKKAKNYVRDAFEERPHHSFDNWMLMFNHSIRAYDWASRIVDDVAEDDPSVDTLVVGLGALLHDIGKTYLADEETLHRDHAKLGYEVAGDFISSLPLRRDQVEKLEAILTGSSDSTEKMVIEDADILAFYSDRPLQDAFRNWALARGESEKLMHKLNAKDRLHFEASRFPAEVMYERLEKLWAEYL